MQSDQWPMVGRDAVVATVLGHLADPQCDGVYLVGEAGVGTTRVMDEVLDRLLADARPFNRIVATSASSAVPFAALAPVIPGSLRSGHAPLEVIDLFDRIRTMIGKPRRPTDRFVAGIDDLRWLDDGSVGLLTQLLAAGLATVLATVRPDDRLSTSQLTLESSCSIRRVEVPRLDADDTTSVIDIALSEAVDGTAAQTLVDACRGNPGHLAELIAGSVASGSLTRVFGMWTLVGPPTVTARLERMLDAALDGLSDTERELAELIALAEPVPIDALAAAGLIDGAVDLEQHGVLTTIAGRPASVGFARPLLAVQLRQRLSPLRRRLVVPKAIALVERHPVPSDDLRLALWKLECDLDVSVEQLERAATIARGRNDFEATGRLAAAAVELAPSLNTLMLHAEALHDLCDFDQADSVLRAADERATDDLGRLRVAVLRHRMLLWGRLDGAASAAALEQAMATMSIPIAIDMARTALANTYLFSGHPDAVDDVLAQLQSGEPLVDIAMLFPRTVSAMMRGSLDLAAEVGHEGVDRRAALPADAPVGHTGLSALALGVTLTELGRFEAADEVLAGAYTEVVAQTVPQLHTWLALSRGRVALFAGRIGDARRWFTEGRAVAEQCRFTSGLRIAFTGLAVCAGHLGDAATCRAAARAIQQLQPDLGYHWPERHLALAWAAHTDPDSTREPGRAVELLLAGAGEAAARNEVLLQAELLYEAARFGAAPAALDRLVAISTVVDGPLMAARVAFVQGTAAADPQRLLAAERQFADLGARVAAAECAAELARILHTAGRTRDAQGASLRSTQHRAGEPLVTTPRLVEPANHPRLSGREHEIAHLAVAGLASKAIAQQLGLSVRTVSNHLQNVYLKLGVSGRDDLAEALGEGLSA